MSVELKTLREFEREACSHDDCMTNPKHFMAFFPSGPRRCHFLDPFLGLLRIDGLDGFVMIETLEAEISEEIKGVWLE